MKIIRFILLFASLAISAGQLPAAQLVDRAATTWRWRPGTNEASTPVGNWRVRGFNDSEFTTAPAPFWFDSTGDTSTLIGGTQISGMQSNYASLFLRVTFVLTNTAEIGSLKLGALVDDGFVAWINGTEVQRVNMVGPAGDPVFTNTLANNATEPVSFTFYPLTNPPNYLVLGTNVLAVQVFQSAVASSDLDFDASLEATLTETVPPTIASSSPGAGATLAGLSSMTVTFSEPVSGVDAADLLVNGVAASSVTPVSASVYSFGFPQPAYGTVFITWSAGHSIVDQAQPPNPFNATGPGATWQYNLIDQTAPTLATLSPAAGSTIRALTNIAVLFSEDVLGVNASDLKINNNAATGISGGGSVYTFSFPQPATGVVQVAWAANPGITDTAIPANSFVPGASWLYTLDPNSGQIGGPVISEFMALNSANAGAPGAFLDEDGESSDWIEVQNTGSVTVNLLNWSLTDDAGNLMKWQFPSTNIASGGFVVVFASGKNRRVPGARLHSNFQLSGDGEYLALVRPDGSIASQFSPAYPQQVPGVSYGLGVLSTNSTLVTTSATVRVSIPSSGADGTNWLYVGFDDAGWTPGTNGVGFGTTNAVAADYSAGVLPTAPLGYWRLNENSGTIAANLGTGGSSLNAVYTGSPTLGTAGPRPPAFNGFEPNNNAPTLNGASSYIAGPPSLLSARSAFTVGGWIFPTATPAARTGLFGQNDCVEFGFISGTTLECWTPSGGSVTGVPYPFPLNQWHHVVGTADGTNIRIYVDGQVAGTGGTATANYGSSSFNFNIGGGGVQDAAGNFFPGLIDEVVAYNRALSASEILSLYRAGTNASGISVVPFVRTDVTAAMSNVNASAYIRLPFNIDEPGNVQQLSLRARYDDGFVAYINGIEVARANAPGTPAFNSTATTNHTVSTVDLFQFGGAMLRQGANVLAIQGLNLAANDEDFLFHAELTATHNAAASGTAVYMTGPSPGTANGVGVPVLGPNILHTSFTP
ncbi:MAG: hypothetical protein QOF48_2608, partial [Verrucomicrobiota bacterium]